jgi:hypothetical protein
MGVLKSKNKVLETFTIIINYCILLINAQYDHCVSYKGLLKECDKQPAVAVTVAATASCFKRRL